MTRLSFYEKHGFKGSELSMHRDLGEDVEFKESDHPRDDDGKFTSGGGSSVPAPPKLDIPRALALVAKLTKVDDLNTLQKNAQSAGAHEVAEAATKRINELSPQAIRPPRAPGNRPARSLEPAEISENFTALWKSNDTDKWQKALDVYENSVKPSNLKIERDLEGMATQRIEKMGPQEWKDFLKNEYFKWKYTAPNRLATTTRYLEANGLEHWIRCARS